MRADIVRTANVLASVGIGAGDVAAFVLPNLPDTHFAIWGGEAAGIAMAINPLLDGAQIAELVDAARAKVLICVAPTPGVDIWPKLAPHLSAMPTVETVVWVDLRPYVPLVKRAVLAWIERREKARLRGERIRIVNLHAEMARQPGDRLIRPRTIGPDEPSSYFCTGGTTGRPKIAVRTHGCEVFDVHVDGRHRRRAVRARIAGEIAEAAAEVEHVQARQVRQQTLHRGKFECAVQAGIALSKRTVAFKERCVVVDVLRRGRRRRVGIAAHDERSLT